MDAKTIIDKAIVLTSRQNVDRTQMLTALNAVQQYVITKYSISKFFAYRTVTHTSGVISGQYIKFPRTIEYVTTDAVTELIKFKSLDDVRDADYFDLTVTGTPKYYLLGYPEGNNIQIIPVPTSGTIKIYGEWWPADLTDSTDTNILTNEIPYALIDLCTWKHLLFLGDPNANTFYQSGILQIEEYMRLENKQRVYNVGLNSDPLGNGGVW